MAGPVCLQASYRWEVPETTPLGWVNSLDGSQDSENILITRLLAYYKKACYSGTARSKKCIRKVWGKGAELPCSPQANHAPQVPMCSQTWSLSVFYGGFITQTWLIKALVIDDGFNLQPLFPSPRQGSFNLLILWLALLSLGPKGTSLTQQKILNSHQVGTYKGFWNSMPGMGMKTKYLFFIINHNITAYVRWVIAVSLLGPTS